MYVSLYVSCCSLNGVNTLLGTDTKYVCMYVCILIVIFIFYACTVVI